jgi:hypothetical protein
VTVIAAQQNPTGHGHTATVRPENVQGDQPSGSRGPLINQIGQHVDVRRESNAFDSSRPVIYYAPTTSAAGGTP